MIYIRTFQNHSQYEDYLASADFSRPNVSHCINQDDVHYNPYLTPQVIRQIMADWWTENGEGDWGIQYINTNTLRSGVSSSDYTIFVDGTHLTIPAGTLYYGVSLSSGDYDMQSPEDSNYVIYCPSLDVCWYNAGIA